VDAQFETWPAGDFTGFKVEFWDEDFERKDVVFQTFVWLHLYNYSYTWHVTVTPK